MASYDIRIHTQVPSGTGAAPIAASQSFLMGEPVVVGAAGTLAECGDDPTVVSGIAMGSSQGKTAAGKNGTVPTGTLVSFYKPVDGQTFVTRNFATDGAGTAATPTQANVGDTAGFTLASGTWSLDTGVANPHVEIIAVLDDNGQPVGDTTRRTASTGTQVVFGFLL